MSKPTKWTVLRNRAIWVLIILVVPSFVLFFGATSHNPLTAGGTAGTIFGKPVPMDAFEARERWVLGKLSTQLQGVPADFLLPLARQEAWNALVLLAEAKRQKRRVDDHALAAFIQQIPAFQDQGRFQPEYYRGYLRARGLSARRFEELLREDLLIQQLVDSVTTPVSVSEEELDAAWAQQHERLEASLWVFDAAAYAEPAKAGLTDELLQAWHGAHPERLRIPESLTLEWLGASQAELTAGHHPTDEALHAWHIQHQEEFVDEAGAAQPFESVQAQVRTRVVEAAVRRQLNTLAIDLNESLRANQSFEEIAAAHHLMPRAAGPGPADALRAAGAVDPALVDALAPQPEGALSEIVETGWGVSIGRVTHRLPARMPSLEEVRATVTDAVVAERAKDEARRAAEAFRQAVTAQHAAGWRIEEAALVAGPPARSVSFTRTDPLPQIDGWTPALNTAAFDTPLGALTGVLDTAGGAWVLLRPEARHRPDQAAQERDEPGLREETLRRKRSERFEEWRKALEARAQITKVTEATPATSRPPPSP